MKYLLLTVGSLILFCVGPSVFALTCYDCILCQYTGVAVKNCDLNMTCFTEVFTYSGEIQVSLRCAEKDACIREMAGVGQIYRADIHDCRQCNTSFCNDPKEAFITAENVTKFRENQTKTESTTEEELPTTKPSTIPSTKPSTKPPTEPPTEPPTKPVTIKLFIRETQSQFRYTERLDGEKPWSLRPWRTYAGREEVTEKIQLKIPDWMKETKRNYSYTYKRNITVAGGSKIQVNSIWEMVILMSLVIQFQYMF